MITGFVVLYYDDLDKALEFYVCNREVDEELTGVDEFGTFTADYEACAIYVHIASPLSTVIAERAIGRLGGVGRRNRQG